MIEEPSALLERLGHALGARGMKSTLIEPGPELPLPALLVSEDDAAPISCSVIPTDEDDVKLQLLQLYGTVGAKELGARDADVARLLAAVNLESVSGSWGIHPDEGVVQRCVVPLSTTVRVDDDALVEVVELFLWMLERYGTLVHALLDERVDLEGALRQLAV